MFLSRASVLFLPSLRSPTCLDGMWLIFARYISGKIGGVVSGPGGRQRGKPGDSGAGSSERDYSAEGAGQRYFGFHLDADIVELAARLAILVQEDGTLSDTLDTCKVPVVSSAPGRTKSRGKFGLDTEGRLVLGVHNGHKTGKCVKGGTIPATTGGPPYKTPAFAIAPIPEMRVVNQDNQAALRRKRKRKTWLNVFRSLPESTHSRLPYCTSIEKHTRYDFFQFCLTISTSSCCIERQLQ